jgi:glycosyltransferase involved in cell wall biosynthesis
MPQFETSRMLAGTRFERRTDTSLKRNVGLLLARSVGWQRIVFLDDDITVEDPADLRRAVALLGPHYAAGLFIGGDPGTPGRTCSCGTCGRGARTAPGGGNAWPGCPRA